MAALRQRLKALANKVLWRSEEDDLEVEGDLLNDRYLRPLKPPPRDAEAPDLMPLGYLEVTNSEEAASFYKGAFGAVDSCFEQLYKPVPFHKELSICGRCLLLVEKTPRSKYRQGPNGYLRVPDIDAFVARAERGGASLISPVIDAVPLNWFFCLLSDPFGYHWGIVEEKASRSGRRPSAGLKDLIKLLE